MQDNIGVFKKKIIKWFIAFLGLMWLCTVVSKSIYVSRLPVVQTASPEEKYIEHIVEAEGIVEAQDKIPIIALSGLRVSGINVRTGDEVKEGDVLFTIDTDDLKEKIEEKEDEIAKIKLQIDTIKHNEELAKQKKALDEERAREDYDELARYNNDLVGRASEEVAKAEQAVEEEIEQKGVEEASEELKDALKSAAYAEADAKHARDDAIKEAGRKIEDITQPETEDAALKNYELDETNLQEELDKYKEIETDGGEVRSQIGGIVTDINITQGALIPDSAAMFLADDSSELVFKTVIDKEQKKYLGLNDQVEIELEGKRSPEKLNVDYIEESKTASSSYDVYINLPQGVGKPSVSGSLTHSETGDKYRCCISPYAVNTENSRSYVYVVKEREGILGSEYYIEKIYVDILDENDTWTAVEGALDSESEVLVSSTKEVGNGDIVRYG